MTPQTAASAPANGATSPHELFALTDEQILEIEPAAQDAEARGEDAGRNQLASEPVRADSSLEMPTAARANAEPPAWLAKQMKDPWAGEEARELWEGVQRAQAEAAEYKQVFEKPEAARTAAERARALNEFDAAYFGVAGKSAEETAAARTALAQRMMREDPAAFQEMVLAGVKALEEAKKQGSNEVTTKSAAAIAVSATQAADAPINRDATQLERAANAEHDAKLAAYTEFEKAANADLEKSVGGAIERALRQALPNGIRGDGDALTARLSAGVRQEIEKALQGDRQLGEQVAQVLSTRRFDDNSRAQVVRLINERAQQLVPSETKRVLNDWTQTTLAAHRSKTEKQETASQRADLAPAQPGRERAAVGSEQRTAGRAAAPAPPRGRIDYKKLSDEQILEL